MKVTSRQQMKTALVAGLWLFVLTLQALSQSVELRPATESKVVFTVSVTNHQGYPIKGLKPEHFKITSDKTPVEITDFSDQDEPFSVVFLVDTSRSMSEGNQSINRLGVVTDCIENFLLNSHQENEYAILSFSNEIYPNLNWTKDGSSVAEALTRLMLQPVKGQTALYDACRQGMRMLGSSSHRKRVIVLLSDGGMDNASREARFGKVKQEVLAKGVLIYTISIGYLPDIGGQDALDDLSKQTGGLSFIPKNQYEMNATFELLALLLRNQYKVGFKTSPATSNGKSHSIKVEIKLPPTAPRELKYPLVKYRSGYVDRAER